MARWLIGLGVVSSVSAVALALAWGAVAPDRAGGVHTPMHIGCRHHNHGPKWFADHGKILGQGGGRAWRSRPSAESDDLSNRSLTAGRSPRSVRGEN